MSRAFVALGIFMAAGFFAALGAAQLRPVAFPVPDASPQVPEGLVFCPDLTYCDTDTGPLQLDLAYPAGSGPFPLVVIFHGTGFAKGRKNNVPLTFHLAAHGYAAATVSFRFKPTDPYPASIDDARNAVRWLRTQKDRFPLDADHVAALGFSGGGTLACLLGLTDDLGSDARSSSKVQAVISYFAPTDLVRLHDECSEGRIGIFHATLIKGNLEQWLGGTPATVGERYVAASPVNHVDANMPPTLLLHGTADDVILIGHGHRLVERAAAKGAKVTLVPVPGAPHNFDENKDAGSAMAMQTALQFLDQHLKGGQAALARK